MNNLPIIANYFLSSDSSFNLKSNYLDFSKYWSKILKNCTFCLLKIWKIDSVLLLFLEFYFIEFIGLLYDGLFEVFLIHYSRRFFNHFWDKHHWLVFLCLLLKICLNLSVGNRYFLNLKMSWNILILYMNRLICLNSNHIWIVLEIICWSILWGWYFCWNLIIQITIILFPKSCDQIRIFFYQT